MDKNEIDFSVVIPTFGREKLVHRLLESLSLARSIYPGKVEILIVDSSNNFAAECITASCKEFNAQYFKGQQSVRWKRNFGVSQSACPIILFIDSDCRVDEFIFHEHARIYLENSQNLKLGGVFGVTRFEGERKFIWKVIERTSFLDVFSFADQYPYVEWAIGNNISYYKRVFEQIGRFEENFPFRLGGDDLELGLRISRAGFLIKTNPKAITHHNRDTWNSWKSILERATRWGRMEYYICMKHPFLLRRDLPRQEPLFLFFLLIGIVFAILFKSAMPILLVFLWGVFSYLIKFGLDTWSGERKNLLYDVFAQIPALTYQYSCIIEFIRHGRWDILYKHMIFSNYQMMGEWPKEVRRLWASLISLFLVLIFGQLLT